MSHENTPYVAYGSYLFGGSGNDTIIGGDGDDTLLGGSEDDDIRGGRGADHLDGGTGNDTLDGGEGADTLIGGTGNDSYFIDDIGDVIQETGPPSDIDSVYASVDVSLAGLALEYVYLQGSSGLSAAGNSLANLIHGNGAGNLLSGGDGYDTIYGGGGSDVLHGDEGSDWLDGGHGADLLMGGNGNDTLDGGADADIMRGGVGHDTYIVNHVGDQVEETGPARDIDIVHAWVDFSMEGQPIETLHVKNTTGLWITGNELPNMIFGNRAGDVISSGSGDDTIRAGGGSDALRGGEGNDDIHGGRGSDFIDGGLGADTLRGDRGNDIYVVDNIGDVIIEQGRLSDIDTVRAYIDYSLLGQPTDILRLMGTDDLDGRGNSLANAIFGNAGNNRLMGGKGDDTIQGGDGKDRYYGEAGRDVFVFTSADGIGSGSANRDAVFGFTHGEDLVDLSQIDAATLIAGDQAFQFIADAAFSGSAGQLRSELINGNTFLLGDIDGDGAEDFELVFIGDYTFSTADILL